jgi:hypothetical protein
MARSYRCICRGEEWNAKCPVNYLLQHVLFLGAHHHEGIAEVSKITLERVQWHNKKIGPIEGRTVFQGEL